ncbi:MAG: hypothetical protein CVU84_17075 [Firmicutes bacterium HGW-Firmicutes-1]|jgi:outer membrane lipoprotein-sorting protein|nr:MAG: hypothetical protein CVU84_17075 [Firmicutes bacterium HGW-Firmicutes-1]
MKRVHIIFVCFLFYLVFVAVGCNNNNDKDTNKIDSSENEESTGENNQEDQNDEQNENIEDKMNTQNFAIIVDDNLTGIELIRAAKIINPINAITYDMKTVIGSSDRAYETIGSMIKSGKSYKTKTESQGEGVEVTIYNAEEQMTYKYFEARKQGYKYKDDLSGGNGPAMEGEYDLTMLYAEESNLSKAEVIDYEGDPVIYFEIIEGNNKIVSWISLRYGIAIKTEIYDGDTLATQTTINNISLPASVTSTTFSPPSDIMFEDYSITNEENTLDEGSNDSIEENPNVTIQNTTDTLKNTNDSVEVIE